MPDPFIDAQDLSDILGKDVTADNGALIACDAACDTIRSLTQQNFNADTDTVTLDGTGTDALILPQRPVSAAGTVVVNGGTITDYFPPTPSGLLYRGVAGDTSAFWSGYSPYSAGYNAYANPWVWPPGRQNVVVTYDYGYQPDDLPRDVRMVALMLASRLIVQGVATSETIADATIAYGMNADDLTANELRILANYTATRSF